MDAGISARQARTSGYVRWKEIACCLGATPFLAILAMELHYKIPLSIGATDGPQSMSVANRQGGTALDDYAKHSIAARCKERWPSDRSMQLVCARHAEAGLADLARIYVANLSTPGTTAALTDCFDRYTTQGITDFALVGVCARTQELNSRLQTPIPSLMYARKTARAQGVARRPIPSTDRRPAVASGTRSRT